MKAIWVATLSAAALLAACSGGDDDDTTPTSAAGGSNTPAASATQGTASTGAIALDPDFGEEGILAASLSANGHDRFMAVAAADDGSFFATGFVNETGDQAMVLAKFNEDGSPATDFADNGVAIVNVASGGKTAELSRAVAILDDGKIVIGGPVEHDTSATGDAAKDTDVAVLRFNADGTLDGDFGDEGISIIDLGAGRQVSENSFVGDTSWGVASLGSGKVVVAATMLAEGDGRTDSDYVVFALGTDGELDSSFGTGGKTVIDVENASINARNMFVDGGKVLATGYGSLGGVVQPFIFRLNSNGELDSKFGDGGIATGKVLPGVAESYVVAAQGDHYVSAGYGRGADNTEKVDMILDRWTPDGELDTEFGEGGVTRLDLAGQDDRARNAVVLPDGRILAIGSGKMTEAEVDAMVALFDKDGTIVEDFGTDGYSLHDLGGPNDAFYGAAVAADGKSVIVAGYKGVATDGTGNDDAVLARIVIG